MKYYDITQVYEKGMLRYPSFKDFELVFDREYELGNGMAQSHFEMNSHLGTHLDSPYHMIKGGKRVEDYEPDRFIGRCQVITLKDRDCIREEDLRKIRIEADRLIFKTDNYQRITDGNFENVYFEESVGAYLASLGIRLVGIDSFSVDRIGSKSYKAHIAMLGKGVAILEGIFPQDVPDGIYFMMCLPLRIASAEGCPCRVLLLEYPEIEAYINNRE